MPKASANDLHFPPPRLPDEVTALRAEVRAFLANSLAADAWQPNSDFGAGFAPEFSRQIAEKGWIGMTWPKDYGGHGRSNLERYVVTEELLAEAHEIPDRPWVAAMFFVGFLLLLALEEVM